MQQTARTKATAAIVAATVVMVAAVPVDAEPPSNWLVPPSRSISPPGRLTDHPALTVSHPALAHLLEDGAGRSPFLRRQLERLTREPRVSVTIDLVSHSPVAGARSVTRIDARGPRVQASVVVPAGHWSDTVALVAHEFEHILEHLDGVRLPHRREPSVRPKHRGGERIYETERAIRAGRIVAQEYAAGQRAVR